MADLIKEDLTIRWIVARRKLVQFTNDKTYKLADSVLEHIKEIEKRKTNIPVEVIITPKNQNEEYDLVTFIAIKGETHTAQEVKEFVKDKNPEKKEEPKIEEKKAVYTVEGWSKDGQWYLFTETAKEWFGIDVSMKDIKKGDKVEITYRLGESRGKPVNFITSVKVIQTSNIPENTPNVEANKKSSYSNDSQARAKNTAIMVAKDIVVAYVNSKAGIVDTEIKVGEMLKRLTKSCYETIESL
jgi:hypothetical protein